jgi:hypothetical protein
MKVKELIEHLKMFGDETDVFIQTTPYDLCQPVSRGLISLISASHTERYGMNPAKVLLTAYIPPGSKTVGGE